MLDASRRDDSADHTSADWTAGVGRDYGRAVVDGEKLVRVIAFTRHGTGVGSVVAFIGADLPALAGVVDADTVGDGRALGVVGVAVVCANAAGRFAVGHAWTEVGDYGTGYEQLAGIGE